MWSGVQSVTYSPQTHCATILDFGTFGGAQLWEPQENKILWIAIQCSGHYFSSLYALKDLYGCILEKAMAPHSTTLAWKIPWTEEPGGLQSMGSLGVGHDWATSLPLFTFLHWRRKWQPIPVFLPGESQGRGSLVGCHLWGRTGSDMTEAT